MEFGDHFTAGIRSFSRVSSALRLRLFIFQHRSNRTPIERFVPQTSRRVRTSAKKRNRRMQRDYFIIIVVKRENTSPSTVFVLIHKPVRVSDQSAFTTPQ